MAKRKEKTNCVFDMFHKEKVCDIQKTLEEYINPMDKLRPKKTAAKDYNLSQTFALMDRGAVKLRYTDTHGEYDWFPADYVPPPPKKRPDKGRGPLEQLQDEVWAKVVEQQQIRIKIMNTAKRLKADSDRIEAIGKIKAQITKKVGPDWYQELSNYQRYTIDRLAFSIIWDLKKNSIVCTTQSLLDIGVKCKHSMIASALKDCCASPVEFLLVLYQLVNPKRTEYSTMDRLLLSSIVHLSMRDTLKELHVRIPSPPPKKKRVRRSKPEETRGTCKSPYLDKYLYRAPPLIKKWGKPDKEYPKDEYFSYLRELRKDTMYIYADEEIPEIPKFDRSKISENTDCYTCALIEMELKLVNEWVTAQKVYNKMAKSKRVPALHKASVFASCIKETEEAVPSTEEGSEDSIDEEISKVAKTEESYYVCEESTENPCDDPEEEKEGNEDGEYVGYDHGEDVKGNEDGEEQHIAKKDGKEEENGSICKKYLTGKIMKIKTRECGCCYCKEMILQKVKNTQCQCKECEEERRKRNTVSTPIIFDTTTDDSGKPLKIISGVKSKTICTCLEKYMAKWNRHERRTNIKDAQDDLKSLENKFIIKGMATGPDGKPIYILEGVKDKDKCPCYYNEKYKEEDKRKLALMPKMPDGCIKYIVSGVHSTPEGNVYVISGTTPNTDCQCMDIYNKFIDNHSFCLLLYDSYIKKMENEKQEYFKELSPDYTDFVPKSDSGTRDCKLRSLDPCVEDQEAHAMSCNDVDKVDENCTPCEDKQAEKVKCYLAVSQLGQPDEKICPCIEYQEQTCSMDEKTFPFASYCDEDPPKKCQLAVQYNEDPETNCQLAGYQCEPQVICQLAGDQYDEEEEAKCHLVAYQSLESQEGSNCSSESVYCRCDEDSTDDNRYLERYIILKEFPRDIKEQYKLLKKALATLAEDGFPLAILPEAYRLPQFRIWLKMRSKKFWTQKDKRAILNEVKLLCCNIDKIRETVKVPGNRFLRHEPEKHNWKFRTLIKKENERIRTIFYRSTKRVELNYARMFYPTTYAYEFPSKSFRDVYFCYMPSKEADILPYRIWKSHEYREHIKRRC